MRLNNITRIVNIKKYFDKNEIVYIGRPSIWGNPFIVGKDGTREEVIKKYEQYILSRPELIQKAKKELKGKILGCFCHPLPCHGDILIKLIEN